MFTWGEKKGKKIVGIAIGEKKKSGYAFWGEKAKGAPKTGIPPLAQDEGGDVEGIGAALKEDLQKAGRFCCYLLSHHKKKIRKGEYRQEYRRRGFVKDGIKRRNLTSSPPHRSALCKYP